MGFSSILHAQTGQNAKEAQVKAAYLYNFTKFVYWNPVSDSANSSPLTIGVIRADDIAALLEEYTRSTSAKSGIRIKRFDSWDSDLQGCELVYIGQAPKDRIHLLLSRLKGKKVLTVSDLYGFARQGGMIGFFQEEGRIKIEINLSEIADSGLAISAKLIEVARIIK